MHPAITAAQRTTEEFFSFAAEHTASTYDSAAVRMILDVDRQVSFISVPATPHSSAVHDPLVQFFNPNGLRSHRSSHDLIIAHPTKLRKAKARKAKSLEDAYH
jgi:hypothetical protein